MRFCEHRTEHLVSVNYGKFFVAKRLSAFQRLRYIYLFIYLFIYYFVTSAFA